MIRASIMLAVTLVSVVSGCGRTEAEVPQPPVEQRVSPSVPMPKDARGLEQCDALTAEQVTALGGDPTSVEFEEAEFGVAGSACAWSAPDDQWTMSIGINTDPAVGGLETTYLNEQRGVFAVFEPFLLDGHPAVRAQQEASPECGIAIGLADAQVAVIDFTQRDESINTCEIARQAGSALLSNLPPLER